jgi:hypothetical protein
VPAVLYLSDNSWVIKRGSDQDPITDDMGVKPANGTLTARVYLATTKVFDAPIIHASLENTSVPITDGKLRAVLSGTNLRTHLTSLLDAAEAANQKLRIYEHVIVAGSHHDYQDLLVQRERSAE